MDQFEGGDAFNLCYRLILDPGLDHQISRILDMLLKELDQSVGSLSLRLLKLELPFCLPEPVLQFFLFPDQLVDPGIPFRYLLFPGYLRLCDIYVLDGNITQTLAANLWGQITLEGILLPQLQVKKAKAKDGGIVQTTVSIARNAKGRVRT